MRPSDILSLEEYEASRDGLRTVAMREKKRRRLAVGDAVTFLFENFVTLRYQVQEMVRVERIQSKVGVRHEISTYNELMPGPGELSATMMIEFPDPEIRAAALAKLVGLQDHTFLHLGDTRVAGVFDQRQYETDRISSVQFVRFHLGDRSPEEFARLAAAGQVAIELDHPEMSARALIAGDVAAALVEDLQQSEREKGLAKPMARTAEVEVDLEKIQGTVSDVISAQLMKTNECLETYKVMVDMLAEGSEARRLVEKLIQLSRSHAEELVNILDSLD